MESEFEDEYGVLRRLRDEKARIESLIDLYMNSYIKGKRKVLVNPMPFV